MSTSNKHEHANSISKGHGADSTRDHVYAVMEQAFSSEYYLKRYPDVRESGIDPLTHYIHHGCDEGRDPSPAFSTRFYLERYPDVAEKGMNPLLHYVKHGLREGRRPVPLPASYKDETEFAFVRSIIEPEFDAAFYQKQYPGHERQVLDPLDHFLLIGYCMGNDPAPGFSVAGYTNANADVQASGVNPFYHYLVLGRMERRTVASSKKMLPHGRFSEAEKSALEGEFDAEFYLHRYPDVQADGMDPLEHFLRFGWREGRDPTPEFSTSYYLRVNRDVEECGMNPFYHYITAGRREGRPPVLPGGYVAEALYNLEPLEKQIEGWAARKVPPVEPELPSILRARLEKLLPHRNPRIVLALSHDDYRASVGGVQNCILVEQKALVDAGAVYLNFHPLLALPVLSRAENLGQLLLTMVCNGESVGVASASTCLDVLAGLAGQADRIDLVIHALLGHSLDFVSQLAEIVVNGQCIYWVHDYLSICPGYNLLRNGVCYCGAPDADSMACTICVYGEERNRQLPQMRVLFEAVDFTVMAPSGFAADLWRQKSGLRYRELMVVPHTRFAEQKSAAPQKSVDEDPGSPVLRVAFPGYPLFHKGWPAFRKLVLANRNNPSVEFYLLGTQPNNDLLGLHYTEVRVSANNHSAMMEALVSQHIDLAFIWSVWPETYCITAHEAVAAGVPVLTCEQSGNVAQMVSECDCGLVFRDEEEVLAVFASGEIRRMVEALRARMGVRTLALKYSAMSLEQLGLQREA